MNISIVNLTKQLVNINKFNKFSLFVCSEIKLKGFVSIVLVGKKRIKSLNNKYRKKDKSTDILTFSYNSFERGEVNGEIFINLDDCKKTKQYQDFFDKKVKIIDIIYFLTIHGLLHLKGYNDNTESKRKSMVEKGKKIYNKYRIINK